MQRRRKFKPVFMAVSLVLPFVALFTHTNEVIVTRSHFMKNIFFSGFCTSIWVDGAAKPILSLEKTKQQQQKNGLVH